MVALPLLFKLGEVYVNVILYPLCSSSLLWNISWDSWEALKATMVFNLDAGILCCPIFILLIIWCFFVKGMSLQFEHFSNAFKGFSKLQVSKPILPSRPFIQQGLLLIFELLLTNSLNSLLALCLLDTWVFFSHPSIFLLLNVSS